LICPACHESLKPVLLDNITLDVCANCEGIWFDAGEINRYLEAMANQSDVPDAPVRDSVNVVTPLQINEPVRMCPHCECRMQSFNYSYDSNIILERCGDCGGIWMDGGEALKVASYHKGNPEQPKLAPSSNMECEKIQKQTELLKKTLHVFHMRSPSGLGGLGLFI